MRRHNATLRCACAVLLTLESLHCSAHESEPVPDFAFGRIDIAHVGTFLEKTGGYANYLVGNSAYLAKTVVANSLFRVPIDASVQFDGAARIFLIEPINPGPSQETATILAVRSADAFRRNLIAVYGQPLEREGALIFAVPQPLPEPDHQLMAKLVGERAVIAPSMEILKRLETFASSVQLGDADAELTLTAPAFRRQYGKQIDAAFQTGALLAAENIDALRTVSAQLDELQKRIWELSTVTLRVHFDDASTMATVEISIQALPDSPLNAALAQVQGGISGRQAVLVPSESSMAASFLMDSAVVDRLLKKYGKAGAADSIGKAASALVKLLDGETTVGLNLDKGIEFFAWDTERFASVAAVHQAGLDLLNERMGAQFAGNSEKADYQNVSIVRDRVRSQSPNFSEKAYAMVVNSAFQKASATLDGRFVMAVGSDPMKSVRGAIEHAQHPELGSKEIQTAFTNLRPGTVLKIWVRLFEFARPILGYLLPKEVQAQEILGGLEDSPIQASLFVHNSRAGIRLELPGATVGSGVRVFGRLKRSGVDVLKLISGEERIEPAAPKP